MKLTAVSRSTREIAISFPRLSANGDVSAVGLITSADTSRAGRISRKLWNGLPSNSLT